MCSSPRLNYQHSRVFHDFSTSLLYYRIESIQAKMLLKGKIEKYFQKYIAQSLFIFLRITQIRNLLLLTKISFVNNWVR